MKDRVARLSTDFKVQQIAGSCRLEAIKVSKEDELLMAQIIDGVVDGAVYRQKLAKKYKEANAKLASAS